MSTFAERDAEKVIAAIDRGERVTLSGDARYLRRVQRLVEERRPGSTFLGHRESGVAAYDSVRAPGTELVVVPRVA